MRTSVALLRRAFDAAQATGDLTFAAYSCNTLISILLAAGEPLGEVQKEAEDSAGVRCRRRFGLVVDTILGQLVLIQAAQA